MGKVGREDSESGRRVEVLGFQSRHPSRGRCVGGRTAAESVWSVFGACIVVIGACLYLAHETSDASRVWLAGCAGYVGSITGYRVWCAIGLRMRRAHAGLASPSAATSSRDQQPRPAEQPFGTLRAGRGRPQPHGLPSAVPLSVAAALD
jgi:hypothetical protein